MRYLRPVCAIALAALAIGLYQVGGHRVGNVQALGLTKLQHRLISGFLSSELNGTATRQAIPRNNYYPDTGDDQCGVRRGSNVKLNQNCLNLTDVDLQGRAQAQNETAIAHDPSNPGHLLASWNDYRRGDGACYGSYSLDGGGTWNDSTVPIGFVRAAPTFSQAAARKYWEASGDTSVAWDTRGNAYFACQAFNRGDGAATDPDRSSGIYVFRSTHNGGASWNFPGRPVSELVNPGPNQIPLLDKPYMTVDNHPKSRFRDRIYVSWTLFDATGTANIYEAYSSDYGESFSKPVLVSGISRAYCPVGVAGPGHCDANSFSDPFTAPDGALYVVYQNFNNGSTSAWDNNENQILISKSVDGGVSFSAPQRVSPFNDLPDCATYQGGQDAGVACIPEKGSSTRSVFRAENYPSGQVNPLNPSQVVVTFGSYISKYSNPGNDCVPNGISSATFQNLYRGVKQPGACANKILFSVSQNAGGTFTGTTASDPTKLPVVTNSQDQIHTDQFWQWSAFTGNGKLAVSYYDRQYGNDEFNGASDVSVSGSRSLDDFGAARVTSSSMPPPTEFPDPQGNSLFAGDYTGLTVVGDTAWPVWTDTRDRDLALCPGTGVTGVPPQVCGFVVPSGTRANDENVYSAGVAIPSGSH